MSRVWTTNQRQSSGLPQLRSGNRRKNHEMPPMWGNLFPRPGNVPQLPPLDTFKRTSSTRHQYASGRKAKEMAARSFRQTPRLPPQSPMANLQRIGSPPHRPSNLKRAKTKRPDQAKKKKSRPTHRSVCHRPCHLRRLLLFLQQCQEQQRDGIIRICHEER